ENVLGAVDVDVERLVGVGDVVLDAHHRGQVVDEVGLGDQAVHQLEVEDRIVDVMEAWVVEQMAHLGDRAGIEHEDLVAARDERVAQMRAQKARAACNQNPHAASTDCTNPYCRRAPGPRPAAVNTSTAAPSAPPSNCARVTMMLPSPAAISTAPPLPIATISPGAP